MEESYTTFVNQLNSVVQKYPHLEIVSENGEKLLRGNLDVIDKNGRKWESYLMEIKYKEGFPYRFPKVSELSNKIPKIADWHIYKDGSCCIDVPPSEIIKCKNGITVIGFMESELFPYLFNQTHRRVEGYYDDSGYSHGWVGFYEFYAEKLGTGNNIRETLKLINYIANKPRLNRSNKCFCGSNKLFRKCHMKAYDELKKLGETNLLEHKQYIFQESGLKKLKRFKDDYHF